MSILGLSGGKCVKDSKEHAGKAMWINSTENRQLPPGCRPGFAPSTGMIVLLWMQITDLLFVQSPEL